MIKKFRIKQSTYIFDAIAVIVLIGSFTIYSLFESTKDNIENISINSHIQYIDNITNNIVESIVNSTNTNIYNTLKENKKLRENIENSLKLFITDRYRYVYVVDKVKNNMDEFRFLLDGSKDVFEKSEFEEPYIPLNIDAWNSVYQTKKENYFKEQRNKNVWITYLKPIIINSEVSAIVVIDFSLQSSEIIISTLNELSYIFKIVLIFSVIIFFVIIGFAYVDSKREEIKINLYNQLEEKSEKISKFNTTLEQKVRDEVSKNREKDKQMMQQSRLAQMGEMISMIAHQWRQPLSAISSTSSAINLKAKLNKLDIETTIELSDRITKYSQHLSLTIDDFREFFRVNKLKKETTYTEILKSVLSIMETSIINKNITLIKKINSTTVFNTYPNEIKQVVLNLIKNAEDVLVEKEVPNPIITIETIDNILIVSDNGGGISEDILEKIFDPYFSTKRQKDGTGLGLYMSKKIIEDHCGGKLGVTNSKNGAVFSIKLGDNNG